MIDKNKDPSWSLFFLTNKKIKKNRKRLPFFVDTLRIMWENHIV